VKNSFKETAELPVELLAEIQAEDPTGDRK
jgi:hypothetical protein